MATIWRPYGDQFELGHGRNWATEAGPAQQQRAARARAFSKPYVPCVYEHIASAPSSDTSFALPSDEIAVTLPAPSRRDSWSPTVPQPPLAPTTKTLFPACGVHMATKARREVISRARSGALVSAVAAAATAAHRLILCAFLALVNRRSERLLVRLTPERRSLNGAGASQQARHRL